MKETRNIAIIGGGPIGCYLGSKLSKEYNIDLYEEHSCIGKPVQCTGLLSNSIKEVLSLPQNLIINKINYILVTGKKKKIELKLKNPEIVVDRYKFDNYFYENALKSNVNFFLNKKFKGIAGKSLLFSDGKRENFDILIGADGANSIVRKKVFGYDLKYICAIQGRFNGSFDKESYEVFFGNLAPGFFAWIVPENEEVARIGLGCCKNSYLYFEKFCKRIIGENYKKKLIEFQSGIIPLFDKKIDIEKVVGNKKVYLAGDAAGHVKATTGGGLVPGFKAAEILANCLLNGGSYTKKIEKIKKDLQIHLKIRKSLDGFDDDDYDKLIEILAKKKNKKILENFDRDNPKQIIKRLALEPYLYKYCLRFLFP